jgi:WS/DGAT/MGAT family acyltransferase
MALDVLPAEGSVLWWVQRPEAPLQIAGLAVFEGAPLRDGSGSVRMAELTALVASSLADTPRFRQRVRQLPGASGLAWEDAPGFDVADHLHQRALAAPGDDDLLAEEVSRLFARPLDPQRPLWELWVLDGLGDDRVAILLKASHVLLDGMALLEVALRLLDPTARPRPLTPPPPWEPRPESGTLERLAVAATARAGKVAGALRESGALVTDRRTLPAAAHAALGLVPAMGRGAPAADAGPRPPLTGRVGPRRAVAWTRVPLAEVRAVARAQAVTVNDVILTLVAASLADHLRRHPSDPAPRDPRVVVPISVHGRVAGDEVENRFSITVADLPIRSERATDRLHRIHHQLAGRTSGSAGAAGAKAFGLVGLLPPWLVRIGGRVVLDRQPVADLAVTDLKGPSGPQYLMGARMLEVYPLVGGTGNIATIIGALSYDGALGLCATVDADVVPDPQGLLAGCGSALDELVTAVGGDGAPVDAVRDRPLPQAREAGRRTVRFPVIRSEGDPSVARDGRTCCTMRRAGP